MGGREGGREEGGREGGRREGGREGGGREGGRKGGGREGGREGGRREGGREEGGREGGRRKGGGREEGGREGGGREYSGTEVNMNSKGQSKIVHIKREFTRVAQVLCCVVIASAKNANEYQIVHIKILHQCNRGVSHPLNMKRTMAAVMRAPRLAGDNIPNIANTTTKQQTNNALKGKQTSNSTNNAERGIE